MKELNYIRVVLVEPTHPGNIGAVARAMGNMGVDQLVLVNPQEFPSPVANARASGADWILENARVCDTLDAAISDCSLVFGTTARIRSIEWPSLDPWDAMQKAASQPPGSRVAILFGRESSGLSNMETDRCHHLVRIPVYESFSSLNLGSAVMVLLYELRKGLLQGNPESGIKPVILKQKPATSEEVQFFYQHLEQVLKDIDFTDGRSTKLMRKLKRLFNRAHLAHEEVRMLRGILTAIEDAAREPSRGTSKK